MDEINEIASFDVLKQGRTLHKNKLVPADVRDLVSGGNDVRNGFYVAFDKPESFLLSAFITLIKEHLHTQADTEERLARCAFFDDDLI